MCLKSPDVLVRYAASVIPHPQHIDLPCMQTEKDLISFISVTSITCVRSAWVLARLLAMLI